MILEQQNTLQVVSKPKNCGNLIVGKPKYSFPLTWLRYILRSHIQTIKIEISINLFIPEKK